MERNISLNNFSPISLEEMSAVKLMNRTDTKFVTNRKTLIKLLDMASEEYFAQEIDGEKIAAYHTLYYDTPDNAMYIAHHNGKKFRQKLRVRSYVASNQHFLEVKTKNNKGRTKKKRVVMSEENFSFSQGDIISVTNENLNPYSDFLNERLWLSPELMMPKIENQFQRITLVNKGMTERLTIDHNLAFRNFETGNSRLLEDIVIIELKRDGLQPSPILPLLNKLRIFPMGFSKYCIGMAMTNPDLKQNRFKQRIHTVNKLCNNK